ncbi:TlpA family protein disulfide reductase [Salipaludibacillus sp. LMS25]|uniref:TlpA disulfide reductase family protein n=1 Tax=Salipaludibacillus sp. LMS25 TaxID=2924031 RepID=UPI0020D17B00|nr:TlpA disulfide reductase family protein [Salipaludibacillus sp. LMS25]UTR14553.1 TlpA family protein disulfide reductase [Salipaludibacillus sp. LMS25]
MIFIAAIGIGGYVIYEKINEETSDKNEQLLTDYLESGGIERESVEDLEDDETAMQPGMAAQNFTLTDIKSKETITLSDLRGNYVILNMWASWCPPCRDEMPDFIKFYEEYQDDNVVIVAINMTTEERSVDNVQQFVNDFNIPFYILLDEEGEVKENYDVHYLPTTLIIDPDGKVTVRRPGHITYDMLVDYYEEVTQND